jgi:Zn-dependent protease with chaperone function
MFLRIFVVLFFIGTSNIASANCKGIWEVNSLAVSQKSHLLISDKNQQYQVTAAFLANLADVHRRVDRVSGIFTRFVICNSDEPNALAWKEGEQNLTAITLGLTSLLGDDYDAYAAIIGHENAHLTQNHIAQKKISSVGFGILQVLAGIALEVAIQGAGGVSGIGSDIASIGTQGFSASYSRLQEYEAERLGLQYSANDGFSLEGAIRLHEKLRNSGGFLSTHPSSSDRNAELRKIMADMGIAAPNNSIQTLSPVLTKQITKESTVLGMVITAKDRLGYYIGSQTGLEEPIPGMRVSLVYENGEKLDGVIRKVTNGYFSVATDRPFSKTIEGGVILKNK